MEPIVKEYARWYGKFSLYLKLVIMIQRVVQCKNKENLKISKKKG